jgi:hypothetical protein
MRALMHAGDAQREGGHGGVHVRSMRSMREQGILNVFAAMIRGFLHALAIAQEEAMMPCSGCEGDAPCSALNHAAIHACHCAVQGPRGIASIPIISCPLSLCACVCVVCAFMRACACVHSCCPLSLSLSLSLWSHIYADTHALTHTLTHSVVASLNITVCCTDTYTLVCMCDFVRVVS